MEFFLLATAFEAGYVNVIKDAIEGAEDLKRQAREIVEVDRHDHDQAVQMASLAIEQFMKNRKLLCDWLSTSEQEVRALDPPAEYALHHAQMVQDFVTAKETYMANLEKLRAWQGDRALPYMHSIDNPPPGSPSMN